MEVTRGLRPASARQGSTPSRETLRAALDLDSLDSDPKKAFLPAIVAAVLGRYLSCDEIVLGLEADAEGCFAETRVAVSPDRAFDDVVGELGGLQAGGAPLPPEGASSPAGDRLLAHALVCRPAALDPGADGAWRLLPKNVDFDLGNVDCAFAWEAGGGEAELILAFDGNLFETARMEVLLAAAGAAAARAPTLEAGAPISRLPLVSDELATRILTEFNDTRGPLSEDETVTSLIEKQIVAGPDRTAFVFEDQSLSYAELGSRAERRAVALEAKGVRKGNLVGVLVGNSLELPISILACLKLGAIFVPMDEMWPAERLQNLLHDTDPKAIILADAELVPKDLGERLVFCGEDDQGDPPPAGTREEVLPTDLIYGIPTSGSTGPPKCSLNIHRGLVNRFQYMTRRFESGPNEVSLQNSRPAFDSSLWQLLWPLTNGAKVVIPRASKQLDLAHTIELIERHRVTMTDFVPSVFNTLVRQLEQDPGEVARLTSLRNLLIGGEEINPTYCRRFAKLLPTVGLTNTYGPTEASIGMVFHAVDTESEREIPIGRPIDNTYAVVLDEEMKLVPPGMIGELYIGGVCLGAGYLRDPERTAQAWVPNPFEELKGRNLYRTGDLVHQAPDGMLYFVGRLDGQVKIGGIRVELGEIEHALVEHREVDRAVVSTEESSAGDRLVAYVVSTGDPSPVELKNHLLNLLPKQAVPGRFVFLDDLPLTHNGKLDRKRLAAMVDESTGGALGESPAEVALGEIWRELLGRDDFGVDDDFFQLGGDSLLVVHLVFDIADRFGERIPLRSVYEAPTIRRLAPIVSGERPTDREPSREDERELAESDSRTLDDLSPVAGRRRKTFVGDAVLVTGATGFVGVHVLAELMARTEVEVVFLARDGNGGNAAGRLCDVMTSYGLWDDSFGDRLRPLAGNLESEGLGLSEVELEDLARGVDTIVNCAGMVDFLHDYGRHRPTNVEGLAQLVRLSARGSQRVHHVSSVSVGDAASPPTDGYGLSKWVAERLAERATERGHDVVVHRLGEVMPHSATGLPNTKALSYLFIRSCLTLGIYPADLMTLDYSPADWVAEAMVDSILDRDGEPGALDLFHPGGTRLDTIMACANEGGFEVRPVTGSQFYRGLEARCELDGDRSLHSLRCLVAAAVQEQALEAEVDVALADLFIAPAGSRQRLNGNRPSSAGTADWPEIDARVLAPMLAETAPHSRSRAYSS
jgi:amino acid adenylation domain-containing protein/thioester reductase-like protein